MAEAVLDPNQQLRSVLDKRLLDCAYRYAGRFNDCQFNCIYEWIRRDSIAGPQSFRFQGPPAASLWRVSGRHYLSGPAIDSVLVIFTPIQFFVSTLKSNGVDHDFNHVWIARTNVRTVSIIFYDRIWKSAPELSCSSSGRRDAWPGIPYRSGPKRPRAQQVCRHRHSPALSLVA